MNIYDYDRQRSYFERTNQRLKRKILFDIQQQKNEQFHKIQVNFYF